MTTLTQQALGPDKKAAEMSDSDEAGHANRANVPAAKAGGTQVPDGSVDSADRKRERAWVPWCLALLTRDIRSRLPVTCEKRLCRRIWRHLRNARLNGNMSIGR